MDKIQLSHFIKNESKKMGFQFCGISESEPLVRNGVFLEKWISNKFHGEMSFFERTIEKRINPSKVLINCKSIILLAWRYYPSLLQEAGGSCSSSGKREGRVAKFALGDDYHVVIKNQLIKLVEVIENKIGKINSKIYVDTGPVLEKAWASKSGVGWIGKNTLLIVPQHGSFFFLSEILTDLELVPDEPIKDLCGDCTLCLEVCPTQALVAPYILDANKCISYLTIELKDKEKITPELKQKFNHWVYGCDECQDVCPWNR